MVGEYVGESGAGSLTCLRRSEYMTVSVRLSLMVEEYNGESGSGSLTCLWWSGLGGGGGGVREGNTTESLGVLDGLS